MFAPKKERLHIQKVTNIVLSRAPFKIRKIFFLIYNRVSFVITS
ncbi:hypothetical protein EMIT040CA3_320136 [Bacillus pseudomycoides]